MPRWTHWVVVIAAIVFLLLVLISLLDGARVDL